MQAMRFAVSFARASAGSNIPARMAMMAITTSNSIKVNARPRARAVRTTFIVERFISKQDNRPLDPAQSRAFGPSGGTKNSRNFQRKQSARCPEMGQPEGVGARDRSGGRQTAGDPGT